MGRFNTIKQINNQIKNDILDAILSNQNILKYIYYNSSNPLNENEIENPPFLINSHIFKRSKIINIEDKAQTFLIIRLVNGRLNNNTAYRDMQVVFDIITHDSLIDNLDNGYDRALSISDELDDVFNGSMGKWIGRMNFDVFKEIFVNEKFSGYRLIYNITNFN